MCCSQLQGSFIPSFSVMWYWKSLGSWRNWSILSLVYEIKNLENPGGSTKSKLRNPTILFWIFGLHAVQPSSWRPASLLCCVWFVLLCVWCLKPYELCLKQHWEQIIFQHYSMSFHGQERKLSSVGLSFSSTGIAEIWATLVLNIVCYQLIFFLDFIFFQYS